MQMSLISLTRKPGVLCPLQTMRGASPAGPGRLQELHSDWWAPEAGTALGELSVLDCGGQVSSQHAREML